MRRASGSYAAAFRFSKRSRMDLALKQHEYQRQLGPDWADKSYRYFHEQLLPYNPLDESLWIASARSALASGGGAGKDYALEDIRMALILNPDSQEAIDLKKQIESQ